MTATTTPDERATTYRRLAREAQPADTEGDWQRAFLFALLAIEARLEEIADNVSDAASR